MDHRVDDAPVSESLSEREREIVSLVAKGMHDRDIAERLHVSVRTVQNHLQHCYAKYGVHSRGALLYTMALIQEVDGYQ